MLYERDVTVLGAAEQRFFVMADGRITAIVKKNELGNATGTEVCAGRHFVAVLMPQPQWQPKWQT